MQFSSLNPPLTSVTTPHFATMLATAQTGGPTTFLAINNMFPAAQPSQTIQNNPGPLVPMASNLGPPNLLTAGPFILPSGFGPGSNSLTCTVPISSPPHLQAPLLPFFTASPSGNVLGTNSTNPLPMPTAFGAPQLLQPGSNNLMSAFPSASTGLNTSTIVPASLFPTNGAIPMTSVPSTLLSNQPMVLPTLPISFGNQTPISSGNVMPLSLGLTQSTISTPSQDILTSVNQTLTTSGNSAPPYTSTLFPVASQPNVPNSTVPNVLPNTTTSTDSASSNEENIEVPTSNPVKIEKPTTHGVSPLSNRNTYMGNLLALEAADFHRDAILDAIDKLRERKARPDFERISCLLKRYQNINPDQTQLCLGRLADAGAVVCVDYKGNMSYRNPSKWRKTAATSGSGTTNLPSVSARLVEAVKRLMEATSSASTAGPQSSLSLATFAIPGPNGGYSLFQIERSLQFSAGTDTVNSFNSRNVPELTGATLRVCLDREATHGKLAKTTDGRYVLDEYGERKRSSPNMGFAPLPQLSNKRALPPHTFSGVYLANSSGTPKVAKPAISTGVTSTVDYSSLTSRLHPLAAKQPSNVVSIAPSLNGRLPGLSPISSLSMRPASSSRRGRPPGSKTKKPLNVENMPPEKKVKVDHPVPSTVGSTETSSTRSSVTAISAVIMDNSTLKSCDSSISNSIAQSTSFPPPVPFITGITANNPVIPGSILPTSFSVTPIEHSSVSGVVRPLLPYSSPQQSISFTASSVKLSPAATLPIVPSPTSSLSNDFISTCQNDTSRRPNGSLTPDSSSSEIDLNNIEKLEGCSVCCRCGGRPTPDEAFLICKDCCSCVGKAMANTNDRSSLRNYLLTTGLTSPFIDYRTSVMYSRSHNHHTQQFHSHYPHRLLSSGLPYAPVFPNLSHQESYRCCSELIHHKVATENFRVSSISNCLSYPGLHDDASLTTHSMVSHSSMNMCTGFPETMVKRPRIVRTHFYSNMTPSSVVCSATVNSTVANVGNDNTTNGNRTTTSVLAREISSNHLPDITCDYPSSNDHCNTSANDTKLSLVPKSYNTHLAPASSLSSSELSSSNMKSNAHSIGDISLPQVKSDKKSNDSQEHSQSVNDRPVFRHEPRKRKTHGPSATGSENITPNSSGHSVLALASDTPYPMKKPAPSQYSSDYETQVSHVSTITQADIPNLLLISKSSDERNPTPSSSRPFLNSVVGLNPTDQTSTAILSSSSDNYNFRTTLATPRRPILPNPIRKHPNPLLLTSRLILKSIGDTGKMKSILQNRSDMMQSGFTKFDSSSLSPAGTSSRNFFNPASNQNATDTVVSSTSQSSNDSLQTHKPRIPETKVCVSAVPKLIPSEFYSSPAEELLWETGFFGKTNPQQLVCTMVFLFAKLLNLRKAYQLRQLRFGTDGQLKLVLSSKDDDVKLLRESLSSPSTSSDSKDKKHDQSKSIDDASKFYLLYKPDPDITKCICPTDYINGANTNGNSLKALPIFKDSCFSIPTNDNSESSGYLLDHFPKNNHQRCLVCLHIFYLSKRPGSYMNSNSSSYFLAWLPEPSANLWFRHRPIGHNHLTAILRTIDTTLDYTTRVHLSNIDMTSRQLKNHTELTKLVSGVSKSSILNQVSLEESANEPMISSPDCPLNLVIRECAIQDQQQQQQRQEHRLHHDQSSKAHPTCMHYWPELTERARQSPWQCASCKTCAICENKTYTTDLLICDACDKGYHVECHKPELHEPIDRSLPWVCSGCLDEGYRVAIGTLPSGMYTGTTSSGPEQKPVDNQNSDSNLTHESGSPDSDRKPDNLQPTGLDSSSTDPCKQTPCDPPNGNKSDPQSDSESTKLSDSPLKVDEIATPNKCISPVKQDSEVSETKTIKQDEPQNPDVIKESNPSETTSHPHDSDSSKPQSCTEALQPDPTERGNEVHSDLLPRPDDVRIWSVEHVRDWLLSEGFPREADAFLQQEIDGTCLLLMKRMDVLTELGIKLGPAVKIYERIKRLQSRCSSPV